MVDEVFIFFLLFLSAHSLGPNRYGVWSKIWFEKKTSRAKLAFCDRVVPSMEHFMRLVVEESEYSIVASFLWRRRSMCLRGRAWTCV